VKRARKSVRSVTKAANLREVDAFLIFLVAAVASIIGSLQAGVVNTAVLAHTIQRGPEAGRRMAIGGSIPEFIYAAIAFQSATWLLDWLGLDRHGVAVLVGCVLAAIGLYFLFLFNPRFDLENVNAKATGLRKGLVLGLLNPQLLLFWCGIRLSLTSFGFQAKALLDLAAFATGAFVGALVLLMLLVKLGRRALEKWQPSTLLLLFRSVGAVLVITGAISILRA
jgi:threonine/homoserine/homoserine lactone efflux protein